MAVTQKISEIAVVLAGLICIVVCQGVPDPNMFSNLQNSLSPSGGPTDFSGNMNPAFNPPMNYPGMISSNFGAPPAAAQRPQNSMNYMLPFLFGGSDMGQRMMMMQMLGGGMGGGMGGMGHNPLLLYSLMNAW